MPEKPRIDGRRRDNFEIEVDEMVPYYVEEWNPDEDDVGVTLISLFSELAEEVTERLDRVPEKHRVAFYETVGFDRQPPQPARLPLSVEVTDRAGENVTVPAGTVATAEGANGTEQLFEVPKEGVFEATPADLTNVYSVDPNNDAIYAHHNDLEAGETTTLFDPSIAENLQEHVLYVGDEERLNIGSGSNIKLKLATDADLGLLSKKLHWEYYGKRKIGDETVTGWHPFPDQIDYAALIESFGLVSTKSVSYEFGYAEADVMNMAPDTFHRMASDNPQWKFMIDPNWESATVFSNFNNPRTKFSGSHKQPDFGDKTVTLEFEPDGTLEPTTVDGVESKWIRCQVPADTSEPSLLDLRLGRPGAAAPPIEVGAAAQGLKPDQLLRNDVPLPSSETGAIWPFGKRPGFSDTFYLSSTDALTKRGAKVTITFERESSGQGDPVLSWEYFDGGGWVRIPDLTDKTNAFRSLEAEETHVEFDVPDDLTETTVAGHEGHWIRVRLVDGDYGGLKFEAVDDTKDGIPDRYDRIESSIVPPSFSSISIAYEQADSPDHAIAANNLSFGVDFVAEERQSYQPFERLSVDEQTIFLGFDRPLTDGPINLLFDLTDAAYGQKFHSQLRWEYEDTDTGQWTRPDVIDETEGLTEHGIVGFVFPEATEATRVFGEDCHWLRARVTGDTFGISDGETDVGATQVRDGRACGRYVETVPPAGEPRPYPPTLKGLYSNATWARNRRTVRGEVLGSSDGSVEQTFLIANVPVIDSRIWVDELAVLSEGARQTLLEQWPDGTELETDAGGDPVAFWVEWECQPDLLDSGPDERHYTLDPITGSVSFGDGTQGKIPPRGTGNVRASYATGGGEAGNVPVGTISGFRQSLALIESVTNPLAGAGGADAEPTAAVTNRAAQQLRDRNRAVAATDIERIATDSSRQVARARCLPAMNRSGEYCPGWVTLLVVPASAAKEPMPSATLRQDVQQAVAELAPATLVGADQLVVRGPSYVSLSIDTAVVATGGSISELEERARMALQSFLQPLSGGSNSDGWKFGELPCRSDLYELLEGIDRVDYVVELRLTFETSRSTVIVEEGEETPDTSPDALVAGGSHNVTATLADGGNQ